MEHKNHYQEDLQHYENHTDNYLPEESLKTYLKAQSFSNGAIDSEVVFLQEKNECLRKVLANLKSLLDELDN